MFPTLSGHEEHEEYVHGFHLPLVRDSQRGRAWGHEDIDCGESHAEATAVPSHPIPKTSPVPSIHSSRMVKKLIQPCSIWKTQIF